MEEPKGNKRGWFAPVVLVLLLFSVIGNVLLYSHHLQNGQRERVEEGTQIIQDGYSLPGLYRAMQQAVDKLASADSLTERLEAKQQAVMLLVDISARSQRFLDAADGRNGREPIVYEHRNAIAFFNAFAWPLTELGNHDGMLTDEERAYVASLQPLYAELAALADRLSFNPEITNMMALQAAAGGDWVQIAYDIAAVMDTNAPQLFGSSAEREENLLNVIE